MKSKTLFNLIALGSALIISGTGCRHTPQNQKNIYGTARPTNPGPTGPDSAQPLPTDTSTGVNPTPTGGGALGQGHEGWAANSDILAEQTIRFAYDKSAIRSQEQSKVDAVADYLKGHANVAVRVEGNCDERGTEEYNRSLGERRALAARERIVSAGIDPSRVDIITYGKDKPVDQGHDESAFAKNRRDDFVVLTPPGQ
ncbi:MAG TPA: OmpA family protein [Verrucomicrobiae bacterium]|jgi:peptidoglycan-associated lipoprotein|nr:OmpA family protein [Verrucomicrobiae bacterium]